jgi:glucokinase
VDIGGTKIGVGLVSPSGKVLKKLKVATNVAGGTKSVLASIHEAVDNLWVNGVGGIGVGIAGLVEPKKGIFKGGPNMPLGMKNYPLAASLNKKYKVPTSIDNDVHCFTLAEAKFGAGKGKNTVFGVTFGTGIGGGIVIGGRILRGKNNACGEIGHMTIDFSGAQDKNRGLKGDFESMASGRAMSSLYAASTGRVLEPLEVQHLAEAGDAQALEVMRTMSSAMAAGISSLLHAFDPDIIVAGGGLSAVDALWKPMLVTMRDRLTFPDLIKTPVVRAKLGSDANIIGAALLLTERDKK